MKSWFNPWIFLNCWKTVTKNFHSGFLVWNLKWLKNVTKFQWLYRVGQVFGELHLWPWATKTMYWQVNQNQKSLVLYSISDHFLYFPFQPVSQFTDIYMKEWLLKYVEKKRVRASYLLVFKNILLCWIKFIWCTCWIYLFYTLRFSAPLSLIGKLKRINW